MVRVNILRPHYSVTWLCRCPLMHHYSVPSCERTRYRAALPFNFLKTQLHSYHFISLKQNLTSWNKSRKPGMIH